MKILVTEKLSEHKYKTPEGYLVCVDAILARTGKQTYRKNEVFATDDTSEIEVDRTPEEVFSKQTLASFENKPITVEHPDEDVNASNHKDLAVGFVRDVHEGMFEGQKVMLGTLVITDAQTIEEIEDGEHTDLSCGYDCDIDDVKNPQQKNIRGNHVALCQCGRAGIARIVDSVKDKQSTNLGDKVIFRNRAYVIIKVEKKKQQDVDRLTLRPLERFNEKDKPFDGGGDSFWDIHLERWQIKDSLKDAIHKVEFEVYDYETKKTHKFSFTSAKASNVYDRLKSDAEKVINNLGDTDIRNMWVDGKKIDPSQVSGSILYWGTYSMIKNFMGDSISDSIHDATYEVGYVDRHTDQSNYVDVQANSEQEAKEKVRKMYKPYHIFHCRKVKDSMNDAKYRVGQNILYHGKKSKILKVEYDEQYGYDLLIVNPDWDGKDKRFENVWVGEDVKTLDCSTKDAKQNFNITWIDTYTKSKGYPRDDWRFITDIKADTLKEALQKLADKVALAGIGTANALVISVSSDRAVYQFSGKLSDLIRRNDLDDSNEELDIQDCDYINVDDSCTKDALTPVHEQGRDDIIYVMQSDVDKNLYFYIGKIYSMRDGEFTYQKYKMNGMTPDQLKKELEAAGWHRVNKGPYNFIDSSKKTFDSKKVLSIVKAAKSIKVSDRLAPSQYKALRELGYNEQKWKNMTSEQATKIIQTAKAKQANKSEKEKESKTKSSKTHTSNEYRIEMHKKMSAAEDKLTSLQSELDDIEKQTDDIEDKYPTLKSMPDDVYEKFSSLRDKLSDKEQEVKAQKDIMSKLTVKKLLSSDNSDVQDVLSALKFDTAKQNVRMLKEEVDDLRRQLRSGTPADRDYAVKSIDKAIREYNAANNEFKQMKNSVDKESMDKNSTKLSVLRELESEYARDVADGKIRFNTVNMKPKDMADALVKLFDVNESDLQFDKYSVTMPKDAASKIAQKYETSIQMPTHKQPYKLSLWRKYRED